MNRLYSDLAQWFPLLTHPGDYAEEAAWLRPRLGRGAKSVLELGCGGGHTAHHLGGLERVLTDLSAEMLGVSRRLNPDVEHVQGDMRTLRLERTFDAVFVHDAVMYMLDEDDLFDVFETARAHLEPGGRFVALPDSVAETFEAKTRSGGHDCEDGRSLRYLSWTLAGEGDETTYEVHFAILVRHPGGRVEPVHDHHRFGLFPKKRWVALLEQAGFKPRAVKDPWGRQVFVATAVEDD